MDLNQLIRPRPEIINFAPAEAGVLRWRPKVGGRIDLAPP